MPRMWVTVLASILRVSMETLDHALDLFSQLAGLATVFMTSRRRVFISQGFHIPPGNRIRYSDLNSSISTATIFFKFGTSLGIAAFQLLQSPIQDGVGMGTPIAPPLVVEDGKPCPVQAPFLPPLRSLFPAGDIVVDQLGDIGVCCRQQIKEQAAVSPLALASAFGLPPAIIFFIICRRGNGGRPGVPWADWAPRRRQRAPSFFFGDGPGWRTRGYDRWACRRSSGRLKPGTRGTFTMPDSMASMSEKSETTQGNKVPSA